MGVGGKLAGRMTGSSPPMSASTASMPDASKRVDGGDHPDRVRRRLHSTRCVQRMRLLRGRLSVRSRRSPPRRRPRVQMHVLIRPPARRRTACVREACPTSSILFGDLDELQKIADARIAKLHDSGMTDAVIYKPDGHERGRYARVLLVRGDIRSYNMPPRPEVPTTLLRAGGNRRRSAPERSRGSCCWRSRWIAENETA